MIKDWISKNVTEPLQEMIIDSVNAYIISFLASLVDAVTLVLYQEMTLIQNVFENTYFTQTVLYMQGLAFSLLTVRVMYQSFQQYVLYSTGQESSPGQLLKEMAIATAVIASVPWIVRQVYVFSIAMVDEILNISATAKVNDLEEAVGALINGLGNSLTVMSLLLIIGLVMVLIVLLQIAARTVTIGLLMVVGPFMWAMKNDLGGIWFRAVVSNCLAMPLQMFLLRGALGSLAGIAGAEGIWGVLLFIGFMWVTVKSPQFLQQWANQTGIGSAVGGAAQTSAQFVILRKLMTRGA